MLLALAALDELDLNSTVVADVLTQAECSCVGVKRGAAPRAPAAQWPVAGVGQRHSQHVGTCWSGQDVTVAR